jgi:hypothetical protein
MRAWFVAFAVLIAAPASATTYYVDISCTFNGTGTTDACAASGGAAGAYNSVAALQTLLGSGGPLVGDDVVLIKSGTYVTSNNGGQKENSGFFIGKSGTAGHQITVMNYPGQSPVLSNCPLAQSTICARATITAYQQEYITVQSNTTGHLVLKGGVWLYGKSESGPDTGSRGLIFRNLEITQGWGQVDDGNWSAFFIDGQDGAQFDHNYIHDMDAPTGAGSQDSASFFKLYYNSDVIIEYNTGVGNHMSASINQAGGVDDKAWGTRNIHRYNWLEDLNTCVRLNTQSPAVTMTGVQVYGNVCVGNASQDRGCFKFTHDITSAAVYNNTCWRFSEGLITESPAPVGIQFHDNILANLRDRNVEAYVAAFVTPTDYNAWGSGAWIFPSNNAANLAAWQATGLGWDAHSHTTACSFTNAVMGGGNFHLTGGTCATGGKVGGVSGGATIEQGAYGVTTCVGYTCGASAGAAPTVTSVSPSTGTTAGGTALTITGADFVATPTITVGGAACTGVGFTNSTTITCTTPAHAAGAVNVIVTNPDTQTGTGVSAYTYVAAGIAPRGLTQIRLRKP